MYKYARYLLLICLMAGSWSCSKELSKDTPQSPQGVITMKVDGVEWKSDKTVIAEYISENSMLVIYAESHNGTTLRFLIPMPGSTGTRTIDYQSFTQAYYTEYTTVYMPMYTSYNDDVTLYGGELTITAFSAEDNTISATFQLELYDPEAEKSVNITEGSITNLIFNGEVEQPEPPMSGFANWTIDGKTYESTSGVFFRSFITGFIDTKTWLAQTDDLINVLSLEFILDPENPDDIRLYDGISYVFVEGKMYAILGLEYEIKAYNPETNQLHVVFGEGIIMDPENNSNTKAIQGGELKAGF